ncbi:hypothetical protein DFH09DRAFT_277734 [Mycena vulgaris]|nr:hypothetical protein DFH09DRAFT_277734 [Mycena vulgaris]
MGSVLLTLSCISLTAFLLRRRSVGSPLTTQLAIMHLLWLASELRRRNIPFDKVERCIRCFPQIVSLACKAVLSAIINLDFAAHDANDFEPFDNEAVTFMDAIDHDPIATLRTIVRPNSRDERPAALRDVVTHWSSALLMIERAILLREL